jgi:hypothetical protein
MTEAQAKRAMNAGTKIEAGAGDDYDTGRIIEINGDMAVVAWDSGTRTPCPVRDISIA